MAGIYLHIPFCKKACHYCDFHFSTSLRYKNEMLDAMKAEILLQKDYLGSETIDTIYFGGGTPSVLATEEVIRLIDVIADNFNISSSAEITLEANPDDLDQAKILALKASPVNRFSIGIQSFHEEDLRWMNRAHTAGEAESAIKGIQDAGFLNITLDLIYGYPLLSDAKWLRNIEKIIEFGVPHVSAYSMTVEPKTALASFIASGKQQPINEAQSAVQFQLLIDLLMQAGFEHYEISNFAKPDRHSRHNSNYWKGISYLGIGPSAHSFNGSNRQWNISNNAKYLESISNGIIPAEIENLSISDRVNEYLMTSLRTKWGTDLRKIENDFGLEYRKSVQKDLQKFLKQGHVYIEQNTTYLTPTGKLFADRIAAELFVD